MLNKIINSMLFHKANDKIFITSYRVVKMFEISQNEYSFERMNIITFVKGELFSSYLSSSDLYQVYLALKKDAG